MVKYKLIMRSYPQKKHISKSPSETKNLGEILAKIILDQKKNDPRVFALQGDLGSGKTTFIQGLAKGLGIKEKILSPTFVIMKKIKIPKTKKNLYHLDCYRLEGIKDLKALNFEEILSSPNNLVFLEWPEKIKKALPSNTFWIKFKNIEENTREISFKHA